MGLVVTVDDAISLPMYFGLLCNGTTNLAATWKDLQGQLQFGKDWHQRKTTSTKLFDLLVFIETQRRERRKTNIELIGSCKLPRFQYSNYGSGIVKESNKIHSMIKDYLMHWRTGKTPKSTDACAQHATLFNILSDVKGVGTLTFNQLWHALCLSGVLPLRFLEATAIAPASGPAKLIQTYYPKEKTPIAMLGRLHEVRGIIQKLGLKKLTDVMLENAMCELWRLGNSSQLCTSKMTTKERKKGFASDQFHAALLTDTPTKHPDIYYINPFTKDFQHLFRVIDSKDLTMRLSFLDNPSSSSINVHCVITCDNNTDKVDVKWTGSYTNQCDEEAATWFIKPGS